MLIGVLGLVLGIVIGLAWSFFCVKEKRWDRYTDQFDQVREVVDRLDPLGMIHLLPDEYESEVPFLWMATVTANCPQRTRPCRCQASAFRRGTASVC